MASLTGQTIQSTYDALLKISGNDALTSSLQRITDGLGNFSPLYLSTTAVEISSGLNVIGSITGSNLSGTNTGDETNSTIKSKLGAATSSNDGYLTSTDWSTFNNKQNALTNPVTGTGTTNTLPKFTGASAIGNSNITDTGSLITLGSNSYVNGNLGIGSTGLTQYNLRLERSITGNATSFSFYNAGIVQSDVTTTANYNATYTNTAAASFTLAGMNHYNAIQGIFGAGSTVTTQSGFRADSSLIGATNNYGFRGLIPSGTNRWNLYMDGTANNYLAGGLGIGATFLTAHNLRVDRNITGGSVAHGIYNGGQVQSDVTTQARYYTSAASTQATTFTCSDLRHYLATQGTFGAGSTVALQMGFMVDSTLIGGTQNFGFRGQIPSGTNRWNIYMDGTADNYLAGSLGIGTTALTGVNLNVNKAITGGTTAYGMILSGAVQSDVTANARLFYTNPSTQAAAFTVNQLVHYYANQGTFGAGSTVNVQTGFLVESTLIGATNNYGFRGIIPAGTGRWNLYMDGTANNYINGALGISTQTLTGFNINIARNLTGAITVRGIQQAYTIQSDVTNAAIIYSSGVSTAAATFTLPQLTHYFAGQGTIGAGSTVTDQHGFRVESTLIGATNNYGFRGQIASGTGRWNLYMDGTANNYLAGSLGIGTTTLPSILTVGDNGTGLQFTNAASGAFNIGLLAGTGSPDAYIYNRANSPLIIGTNNAERMRITSGGNVGIGTSSPNEKLSVVGAISANNGMIVQGYSAAASGLNCEMGVVSGYVQYNAYNRSTSAYGQFRLDGSSLILNAGSNGNVGIGTTSPSYPLQVNGLISSNRTSNTDGGLVIGTPANGNYIYGTDSGNYIATYTANAERMRITSGGNVGIGTSSPIARLTAIVGASATDVHALEITNQTDASFAVYLRNNITTLSAGGAGNMVFSNSAERMRIASDGAIQMRNVFNRRTASYTLVLGDAGKIVETNLSSANTITVPFNTTADFPIGTEIMIMQYGSGQTTISPASGVSIRSKNSNTKIADQYTGATLVKVAQDEWYLVGNLTA